MRRHQTLWLLASTVVIFAGCRFAEWIGEQRAIEQERRDAWNVATEGSYNGSFSQDGADD
jgi:hypothetical protein